jgi:hypothetical protein
VSGEQCAVKQKAESKKAEGRRQKAETESKNHNASCGK